MEPGGDDDIELRGRSLSTKLVAVLTVLALVAGGIVIALDRTEDDDPRTTGSDDTELLPPASLGPPPARATLEAVVADLSAFVSEQRGLAFREEVEVTLLDDAAFRARVQEDAVEDLDELAATADVLRALGLLDAGVDLAETLRTFLGAGVVGFYDSETGELVVRGAAITPYVRLVLVHELTHALDDQHFELHRPELDDVDDEAGMAFTALVEGNALRVEQVYRGTLTEDEEAQARAEEARLGSGIDVTKVPRVVPQLIGFPYLFGPELVAVLDESGGEERIDAAFDAPPVTSEQVLEPIDWLGGEAEPVSVPPPTAGGEVFDEGVLGLWGLYLLLFDEVGDEEAVAAARGWGGDWYVAWRDGDETCVRATVVMDSPEDLRELASGLDLWAAARADAVVGRGDGRLTLESCAATPRPFLEQPDV